MASVALLLYRAAPGAPIIILIGLTGFTGLAALALAFALEDAALSGLAKAVIAGVATVVLCALATPDARLRLASLASAAFGLGLAFWLVRTARAHLKVSWPLAALFALTLALISAYAAYLVLVSRDLMIADFTTYRGIAMMVARLADAGEWPLLLGATLQSVTQDYSWAPALVPGFLLALTEPTSRAIYTFALLAPYAAPAALALAILARDCARRAGLARGAQPAIALALGVAAVLVAYPAAMAVAARGMPDVGGLVLFVCALRLAERLSRLLALCEWQRARAADDPPRRLSAGADPVCDVCIPALVCVRSGGDRRRAGAGSRIDRTEERRALSLEGRNRGGRARRPHAARAFKPGPHRLGAELERA
jgi:hypothetical protein